MGFFDLKGVSWEHDVQKNTTTSTIKTKLGKEFNVRVQLYRLLQRYQVLATLWSLNLMCAVAPCAAKAEEFPAWEQVEFGCWLQGLRNQVQYSHSGKFQSGQSVTGQGTAGSSVG